MPTVPAPPRRARGHGRALLLMQAHAWAQAPAHQHASRASPPQPPQSNLLRLDEEGGPSLRPEVGASLRPAPALLTSAGDALPLPIAAKNTSKATTQTTKATPAIK
mmetsp:Transcript_108391/g.317125  ORF Transcript_108391/g.317125 Transcript_108391/m.317125 type:complete len:106 (+) Transcript_108391:53-370(+)